MIGIQYVFPVSSEDYQADCNKKNFYNQMRQKITERIEHIKAREQNLK